MKYLLAFCLICFTLGVIYAAPPTVSSMSAGSVFTITLKTDGTVWSFGRRGLLGDTVSADLRYGCVVVRAGVSVLPTITAISAGGQHTLVLDNDSTVWSWGQGEWGQLGNNTDTFSAVPVFVDFRPIIAISASGISGGDPEKGFSLALRADSTVWSWGYNGQGELGDSSKTLRKTPVRVRKVSRIIAISAGNNHCMALKSDSSVWCWGSNNHGQLSTGDKRDYTFPVHASIKDVIAISAGNEFCLALKSDSTVWAWGRNDSGQLGHGDRIDHKVPVQVGADTLREVIAISASHWQHGMALRADSTVWVWGSNTAGQLAVYDYPVVLSPVQAGWDELTGVISISAGDHHSLIMKPGGLLYGWGSGIEGQLGNHTCLDSRTPSLVIMP